ncbi:hypothetical protein [Roseateles sp. LYH14W]|uniref:Uncharacterized protein n=1 Tax=Pelomonas parva TaxID=3299032 RepID=A0ABW7FBB3_9BURK
MTNTWRDVTLTALAPAIWGGGKLFGDFGMPACRSAFHGSTFVRAAGGRTADFYYPTFASEGQPLFL